ncbi:MAG: hypothetical protein HQM08_23965 [Candidatus Riflebacteria bacterium]|nr:hypothetical protein [Candidatus Riflebacteria bacterium]
MPEYASDPKRIIAAMINEKNQLFLEFWNATRELKQHEAIYLASNVARWCGKRRGLMETVIRLAPMRIFNPQLMTIKEIDALIEIGITKCGDNVKSRVLAKQLEADLEILILAKMRRENEAHIEWVSYSSLYQAVKRRAKTSNRLFETLEAMLTCGFLEKRVISVPNKNKKPRTEYRLR